MIYIVSINNANINRVQLYVQFSKRAFWKYIIKFICINFNMQFTIVNCFQNKKKKKM